MTPSTDSLSTNPTVPIATDKYGAPLSLPRKQTSVNPVLDQLQNWVKRTGRFQRLIEQGAVYIKGTVYVRGRDDLAILASGMTGPKYTFERPCPTTPGRVQQFKTFRRRDEAGCCVAACAAKQAAQAAIQVSFWVVWLLVLPAHEQAAQAATQVSFGSSRRRPMRAPAVGSVRARV